jgi:hypothetical protein
VFQAIDDYNEMLGNNPKLVVPDEQARKAADAEMQAMARAQAAATAKDATSAAANLGKIPADEESVLTKLGAAAEEVAA